MGLTLKELHIWSDKNNGWHSKKLKSIEVIQVG